MDSGTCPVGPEASLSDQMVCSLKSLIPLLPTYLFLIASAVIPIYAGAHASLSRPSSASKARPRGKRKNGQRRSQTDSSSQRMEGLTPSDAILYPLMTGSVLTFLYHLMKWLKDPAILNKIINWYLSSFGIFAVAKLVGDALSVSSSFVFPDRYVSGNKVWTIDSGKRTAVARNSDDTSNQTRSSPLPGLLSRLPLPRYLVWALWTLRDCAIQPWLVVDIYMRNMLDTNTSVGLSGIIGLTTSVTGTLYFNLISKPWWLTNLFGFSYSYGALQLMSPTTFWTGTLVLASLFIYDIYFVFFTPMMVTVATKLDVPVKLLIPKPSEGDEMSLAMLGLGDIVLPGIMIGLALRYDLYLFYLHQQRRKEKLALGENEPEDDTGEKTASNALANGENQNGSQFATLSEKPLIFDEKGLGKQEYVDATGGWGERFWLGHTNATKLEGGSFPKPYFHASVTGYIIGMLCTIGIMHFAQHAQPALLYLVPSVLISLWGTAYLKGQFQLMWHYSEDEQAKSKEEKEQKSQDQPSYATSNGQQEGEKVKGEDTFDGEPSAEARKSSSDEEEAAKAAKTERERRLFFLAISEARHSSADNSKP